MEDFFIKTIKGPNNSEVSFCGERGGMITSLKMKGKEVFYFDINTFINKEENVRGGIPILFPNAGEIDSNNIYPNLKRHGFARNSKWEILQTDGNGFAEILSSNKTTRDLYPFDFNLIVSGIFESDGSFTLSEEVQNLENDKDLPISMGLHPYFKVPNNQKKNIKFNITGGDIIENNINIWGNGGTLYIDNPKIKDKNALLEVFLPNIGEIVIDACIEYEKIWIWSEEGSDFICIEPMMRDLNGLLSNPKLIKPKSKFLASFNLKIKE